MNIKASYREPTYPDQVGARRQCTLSLPLGSGKPEDKPEDEKWARLYELAAQMIRDGWNPGRAEVFAEGRGKNRKYNMTISLSQLVKP